MKFSCLGSFPPPPTPSQTRPHPKFFLRTIFLPEKITARVLFVKSKIFEKARDLRLGHSSKAKANPRFDKLQPITLRLIIFLHSRVNIRKALSLTCMQPLAVKWVMSDPYKVVNMATERWVISEHLYKQYNAHYHKKAV